MKRISTLALAWAVVVMAVGCGGTDPTKKNTVKGEGGKKLTLSPPMGTSIHQGETKDINVKVTSEKVTDPIEVTISDLPEGVSAKDSSKKLEKGETQTTF